MSELLKKYREIRKNHDEQSEAEVKAFFEKAKLRQEFSKYEMQAKIESGLIDQKKMKRYYELKKKHDMKIPERKIDPKDLQRAYDAHLMKLLQYRMNRLKADTYPPADWFSIGPTPLWSSASPPKSEYPPINYAVVDGNVARLSAKAMAEAEEIGTNAVDKKTSNAAFHYAIPAETLSAYGLDYGGTIRITPRLSAFGSYDCYLTPSDKNGTQTDKILVDLSVTVKLWSFTGWGHVVAEETKHFPVFPVGKEYPISFAYLEGDPAYSQTHFLGPATEVDITNEYYDLEILIELNCEVDTSSVGGLWSVAEAQFGDKSILTDNNVTIEETIVDIVKRNQPPPTRVSLANLIKPYRTAVQRPRDLSGLTDLSGVTTK